MKYRTQKTISKLSSLELKVFDLRLKAPEHLGLNDELKEAGMIIHKAWKRVIEEEAQANGNTGD